MTDDQVANAQHAKYDKKGGFLSGQFVEYLVLNKGDEWVDYYRREPDIFKEVDETESDHIASAPSIKTGTYRHYKGNLYYVEGVARHSETDEYLVVYRPLYKTPPPHPDFWVRPYDMFFEKVVVEGEEKLRFEQVVDDEQ